MNFTIYDQVHILLYSLLFGCISGIVFGAYGYIYRAIHKKPMRFISDFLLSSLFSFLYFLFVVIFCKGRVSVYQILFFITGAIISKDIFPFAVNILSKMRKSGKN